MLRLAGPGWMPTTAYYKCRYEILRRPLGFESGAEILEDDVDAIHAYVEIDHEVVAVGRSHLIPEDSDGCLLYTSPSPRDLVISRMPSSA